MSRANRRAATCARAWGQGSVEHVATWLWDRLVGPYGVTTMPTAPL